MRVSSSVVVAAILAAAGVNAQTGNPCTLTDDGKDSPSNKRWGFDMHRIMGAVADSLLTPAASSELKRLLPSENGSLCTVSTWADEVRNQFPWSGPMHYVNTPDYQCDGYVPERDCPGFCVDSAIQNYTARAADTSLSNAQRGEALKFLTHFIGDLHQPMHAGFAGDLGGNRVQGRFYGSNVNLHGMWDTTMPRRVVRDDHGNSYPQYVRYMQNSLTDQWGTELDDWVKCDVQAPFNACSEQWVQESSEAACTVAYVRADTGESITQETGFQIGTFSGEDAAYLGVATPVFERSLAKSAVRLANVMNNIFEDKAERSPRVAKQ